MNKPLINFICLLLLVPFLLGLGNEVFAAEIDISASFNTVFSTKKVKGIGWVSDGGTDVELELRGYLRTLRYDMMFTGDAAQFAVEADHAIISGLSGSLLWEIGKKGWAWSKGFVFHPNYPLDAKESSWGAELKSLSLEHNLVFGMVIDEQVKAGWTRFARTSRNVDWEIDFSYDGGLGAENLRVGAEFSRDLSAGLSIFAGVNALLTKGVERLALGALYCGEFWTCGLEYYFDTEPYLYVGISHEPDLFGQWGGGIKHIINLQDGGVISIANLQYLGDETITPEIVLTNFGGDRSSAYGNNALSRELQFRLQTRF